MFQVEISITFDNLSPMLLKQMAPSALWVAYEEGAARVSLGDS
jgi:hypothetical protein